MELVLTDGTILNELARENKTLWQKIKDWIAGVIAKLRAAYKGMKPDSAAGRVMADVMTEMDELERLFADAVAEVGERRKTAGGERGTRKKAKSEIRYSAMKSAVTFRIKHTNGSETMVNSSNLTNEQIMAFMEMARKGELKNDTYFPICGNTPETLVDILRQNDIFIENKPIVMQAKKARQDQIEGRTVKFDRESIRFHALAASEILEAVRAIGNPSDIIYQTNRTKTVTEEGTKKRIPAPDNFAVFVTLKNGKKCVVIIEFDSSITIDSTTKNEQHTTVTVFEADTVRNGYPFDYAEYLLENENNYPMEWDATKENSNSEVATSETDATTSEKEFSKYSISQGDDSVNSKFSISEENSSEFPDALECTQPITLRDIEILRSIGRKSINAFTSEDIEKAQKWAYKFYQEMGVKSPFFRAWFGDWREYDTKTKIPIVSVNAETIERGDVPRGDFNNKDTGWSITSNSDGIDETANKEQKRSDSYHALKDIDELLKNAVLLDTIVVTDPSKRIGKNAALMHHLYCPISVNGEVGVAKLYIAESFGDKHKFYLMRIEKASTAMGFNTEDGESTPHSNAATDDATISIAQIFDFVKEHNKDFEKDSDHYVPFEPKPVNPLFLNEDGTPKVFYHGTFAEWTKYDLSKNVNQKYGEGIYLTPDRKRAKMYGDKVIPLYVKATTDFREAKKTGRPRDYTYVKATGDIVVVSPEQIKSATDNIGTFDGTNPDIRYSISDATERGDSPDVSENRGLTDRELLPREHFSTMRRYTKERKKTLPKKCLVSLF